LSFRTATADGCADLTCVRPGSHSKQVSRPGWTWQSWNGFCGWVSVGRKFQPKCYNIKTLISGGKTTKRYLGWMYLAKQIYEIDSWSRFD
jgi:hypothetical protein